MKFIPSMKSRATIRKQKEYDFTKDGITAQHIEEAKKHTYEKPLFIKGKLCDFKMYQHDKEVRLVMFHSYDSFILKGGEE